jgi:ABC-type Fe3+-hydroxamate transport system substrate-binding protein
MAYLRDPMRAFQERAPERIVSLVPSTTGSLIDLGLSEVLVGVTSFCPGVAHAAVVGGPKTPDIGQIVALKPDLILANQEECSREAVEALDAAGLNVWLAFPLTVREMIADLWTIASLFRSEIAMDRTRTLEVGMEWAERAVEDQAGVPYFCPIWEGGLETGERWWMTFNGQTYSQDVLRLAGGRNIFETRQRRYPLRAELGLAAAEEAGERDQRYPRVSQDEIVQGEPEVILLADEPYAYSQEEAGRAAELFQGTPAAKSGRIHLIDGSLIHWPGTRLAQALADLPALFFEA